MATKLIAKQRTPLDQLFLVKEKRDWALYYADEVEREIESKVLWLRDVKEYDFHHQHSIRAYMQGRVNGLLQNRLCNSAAANPVEDADGMWRLVKAGVRYYWVKKWWSNQSYRPKNESIFSLDDDSTGFSDRLQYERWLESEAKGSGMGNMFSYLAVDTRERGYDPLRHTAEMELINNNPDPLIWDYNIDGQLKPVHLATLTLMRLHMTTSPTALSEITGMPKRTLERHWAKIQRCSTWWQAKQTWSKEKVAV